MRLEPLPGLPEVRPGDDLAALLAAAGARLDPPLGASDVLVVAHKVVSKAEGRVRALADVEPSPRALELAAEHGKDARHVQTILDETVELVRADRGRLICRTRHGFVCANAGVDQSNTGDEDVVVLLPSDPDASARALRAALGVGAVVISDSWGRPWRQGQVEVAIGCAGLRALVDHRGWPDRDGRPMAASVIAVADEAAAAADLVRKKTSGEPAVRVQGLANVLIEGEGQGAAELIRPPEDDLFGRRRRHAAVFARARSSNRPRASSTCLPCATDHAPNARSGPASVAPSGVSAYSTRGGTSGCTRRPTSPSRSIARRVWVSTFSEIGSRSASNWW